MAGCSRTVSPGPIPCQGDGHSIPEGHGTESQLTLPPLPKKVAPRAPHPAKPQGRPLLDTPKAGWQMAQSRALSDPVPSLASTEKKRFL